jgi:hypothetical protein
VCDKLTEDKAEEKAVKPPAQRVKVKPVIESERNPAGEQERR